MQLKLFDLRTLKIAFGIVAAILVLIFIGYQWSEGERRPAQIYIHVSTHAIESHGKDEVNDALRCILKNGTRSVMSERTTRNLHWLCVDPITGTLYDIITTFLTKTIANPDGEAEMITAYSPEGVSGVEEYVSHLGLTKEAILVKLRAIVGNIFIGP